MLHHDAHETFSDVCKEEARKENCREGDDKYTNLIDRIDPFTLH